MQIHINGITKQFQEETISISTLLTIEAIVQTEGVAVAVNNAVVPKMDWKDFQINNNDKILIIRAAQGG